MNNIQQSGFVYILHAEGTNRFKIGYSAKPQNRCQDINQQSPFPIKLIHYYPSDDAYRDEQKLHKMFNHRRVHGEWFFFDSVEHIKGLIDEFFEIKLVAKNTELLLSTNVNSRWNKDSNLSQYPNEPEKDERTLLESELQTKIKKLGDEIIGQFPSGKKPSEAAYAVYCFVCETFTGFPIPARECYRKSSLRTQYGLNAEMTEQIFDELQSFGLGMKIVEEINNFKSVKFDPNLDNLQFTNTN